VSDEVKSPADIDPDDLPGECVRQPGLYLKYSRKLADRKRELAELEGELEVAEAETSLAVRLTPSEFGLEKTTEGVIKETVATQPAVKGHKAKVIAKKHEVDTLNGYVTMLDHRKRMIEALVQQKVNDFFGEVKVPKKYKDEVREESATRARKRATGKK
jgi:hypothetical protein